MTDLPVSWQCVAPLHNPCSTHLPNDGWRDHHGVVAPALQAVRIKFNSLQDVVAPQQLVVAVDEKLCVVRQVEALGVRGCEGGGEQVGAASARDWRGDLVWEGLRRGGPGGHGYNMPHHMRTALLVMPQLLLCPYHTSVSQVHTHTFALLHTSHTFTHQDVDDLMHHRRQLVVEVAVK